MDITPSKTKKAMSKDEVALLVDLVQSNPVNTSKETNASTNKLKEECWASLTNTFYAKSGQIPRKPDQLKLKWDNLKKAARKRDAKIRMNNLQTGGGKHDFIPPDETLDKVASVLGSTCTGFDVPFGGDGVGASIEIEVINATDNEILTPEQLLSESATVNTPDAITFASKNNKQEENRLQPPGCNFGGLCTRFQTFIWNGLYVQVPAKQSQKI